MKNLDILISYLDSLILLLKKSPKHADTCKYFEATKNDLQKCSSDIELNIILNRITKLATMSQYTDFTIQQDILLTKVMFEANSKITLESP